MKGFEFLDKDLYNDAYVGKLALILNFPRIHTSYMPTDLALRHHSCLMIM